MPDVTGYAVEQIRRSEKWEKAVSRVQSLFSFGDEYRMSHRETMWRQSEDQYEGYHWGAEALDDSVDKVVVNMSFSTINVIVPYVTGSEPRFLVEPYSGESNVRAGRIIQSFLNRTWRSHQLNGNFHLRTSVEDFLIYGDGFVKVGFDIDTREEDDQMLDIAELFVARLNPWDVWIDPAADGFYNARWCAYRNYIPLSVLQEDDKYQNTKEIAPATSFRAEDDRLRQRVEYDTGDPRDGLVEVIEFYDLISDTLIVFARDHDLPLRVVEGIQLPIVQLANYRIPNSPYHMGELEQIWSLQQELNKTRAQMITHRKRNAQKFIAQEDSLAQGAVDALKSEAVNEVIFVKGNVDISTIIQPLQVPTLGSDAYNTSDLIMRDIYEISGVNEYLRGATPEIRRTATEATIIESASNIKTQHKLRQVEEAARQVGQLLLDIAFEVFPQTDFEEMVLVLTGREAQAVANIEAQGEGGLTDAQGQTLEPSQVKELELRMTPDLFVGRYEVFVETGSTELRNPVFKEQKAREMFELMVNAFPLLSQAGVQVNLKKLLEIWLEAAGIEDIDAVLQPDQQQQMMQQMMLMQQMGAQGGGPAQQGAEPDLSNAQPPTAPITDQTSGALGGAALEQGAQGY